MVQEKRETLQIGIFPGRLLDPATAERLLNKIENVKGVMRIMLQGPGLSVKRMQRSGNQVFISHQDRQLIIVGNVAFELVIRVGRIYVEIDHSYEDDLRSACEKALSIPFEFKKGHFFKKEPNVSDLEVHGSDEQGHWDNGGTLRLGDPREADPILFSLS